MTHPALWIQLPRYAKQKKASRRESRIRKATKPRASDLRQYRRLALRWIESKRKLNEICPVALKVYGLNFLVEEVHHIYGRRGPLLLDQRYWMAVSKEGHAYIHNNIEKARAHGWYAPLGQWNTTPK